MGYQGWLATNALALFCVMRLSATMILPMQDKQDTTIASKFQVEGFQPPTSIL